MTIKTTWRGNTQEVVNAVNQNKCHFRKFLSEVFNACRYKSKVILNLIQDLPRMFLRICKGNGKRGRCRIKCSMTSLYNKGAFTLIELLVVVLIIGILAAVALPQYQAAVLKSRFTGLRATADSLVKSIHIYQLTHDDWPTNLAKLDVTLSADMLANSIVSGTCLKNDQFYCCLLHPRKQYCNGQVICALADYSLGYRHTYAAADNGMPYRQRACLQKSGVNVCNKLPGAHILGNNQQAFTPDGTKGGYTVYIID